MVRNCRVCGVEFNPKPHQIKRGDFACLKCRAEIQRQYAAKHKAQVAHTQAAYGRRTKKQQAARNRVHEAICDGRLIPQPCSVCGAAAEAHHPDYALPLYVIWPCKLHHEQVHHEPAIAKGKA